LTVPTDLHLHDIPKGETERRGAVLQEEIFLPPSSTCNGETPLHLQSLFLEATHPPNPGDVEMVQFCVYRTLVYFDI